MIKGAEDDHLMPQVAGIGFTDVGSGVPGTDSSRFKSSDFLKWIPLFYDRLKMHTTRASSAIGCTQGQCGAPCIIAFAGKRQFQELFPDAKATSKSPEEETNIKADEAAQEIVERRYDVRLQRQRPRFVPIGRQNVLPWGWPLPTDGSIEVWVMPSTSGAAPMTREARYGPWRDLSDRLKSIPWPRNAVCTCQEEIEEEEEEEANAQRRCGDD